MNCRHSFGPWLPGTPRAYDPDPPQPGGLTNDEYYALTQEQRAQEREIRRVKRELMVARENAEPGNAEDAARVVKLKDELARRQAGMRELIDKANGNGRVLTRNYPREAVAGYRRGGAAAGMAEVSGGYSSKRDAERYAVNWAAIDSKSYRAKLDRIAGGNRELSTAMHEDIKSVLKKTDGTAFEELYAYDVTEGKRIGRVINQRKRQKVDPTASFKEAVGERIADGHTVVTCHNHPGSSIPSASDLHAMRQTGAAMGFTFGHDGSIYTYRIVGEPQEGYIIDGTEAANTALMECYVRRERKGVKAALDDVGSLYGVDFEYLP